MKENSPTINGKKIAELKPDLTSFSPKELTNYFDSLTKEQQTRVLDDLFDSEKSVAFISYWEKYLEKENQDLVEKNIKEKRKMFGENEGLPLGLDKKFSEEEMKSITERLGAIQLTYGCSKGCPFCGFDAVPGLRESIPYSQLANLFKRYGSQIGDARPILYWASEPSDYADRVGLEDKTYEDIHELAVHYSNYSPHVTSKNNNNSTWINYLNSIGNSRLSVFGLNKEKVDKINGENLTFIGKEKFQDRKIGKGYYSNNAKKDGDVDNNGRGIGCINGFLLTPRGIYNVVQLPKTNDEYPQGQIVVPFEKFELKNFKEGDKLASILSYYLVELGDEQSSGNNERSIVIKAKDGAMYLLRIDGNGVIIKKETFVYNYDIISNFLTSGLNNIYHTDCNHPANDPIDYVSRDLLVELFGYKVVKERREECELNIKNQIISHKFRVVGAPHKSLDSLKNEIDFSYDNKNLGNFMCQYEDKQIPISIVLKHNLDDTKKISLLVDIDWDAYNKLTRDKIKG